MRINFKITELQREKPNQKANKEHQAHPTLRQHRVSCSQTHSSKQTRQNEFIQSEPGKEHRRQVSPKDEKLPPAICKGWQEAGGSYFTVLTSSLCSFQKEGDLSVTHSRNVFITVTISELSFLYISAE